MKKLWSAAIFFALVASAPAHAGEWSDAARVQQGCDAAGQLGVEAFDARPANAMQSSQSFLRAEAQVWMAENNLMEKLGSSPIAAISEKTVVHAFTRAADAHDAYMYGWGQCMDKYGPP